MSRLAIIVAIAFAAGCHSPLRPLSPTDSRTYQSLLDWAHANGAPGAIVLVHTPQERFLGAAGWADKQRKIPMRTDHTFRIASTTKMFLGIVTAQLHTEGRLDTNRVITDFLPAAITRHIANSDAITVRQLVQHSSGIYDFADNTGGLLTYLMDNRDALVWPPLRQLSYAYDKPAYFPPGKAYHYSNTNFLLLGLILDRVTGHHYSEEVRERILEPLKLAHTYCELYEPRRGELAHGYENPFGLLEEDVTGWTPSVGGHGGMVSTAEDLAVFVRAVTGTHSFLNNATRALIKNQSRTEGDRPWYPVYRYDFGIYPQRWVGNDVPVEAAPLFFGHGGATPGYKCEMFHEPRRDITVVFFCSSTGAHLWDYSHSWEMHRQLGEALFELAVARTPGKPAATSTSSGPS